jgi:hypothetical protein
MNIFMFIFIESYPQKACFWSTPQMITSNYDLHQKEEKKESTVNEFKSSHQGDQSL